MSPSLDNAFDVVAFRLVAPAFELSGICSFRAWVVASVVFAAVVFAGRVMSE